MVSFEPEHGMVFTAMKRYARHRIEIGHVGNKVHLVCLDSVRAHEVLGRKVEDREECNREIVGHKREGRPVTVEEHVPSAELE